MELEKIIKSNSYFPKGLWFYRGSEKGSYIGTRGIDFGGKMFVIKSSGYPITSTRKAIKLILKIPAHMAWSGIGTTRYESPKLYFAYVRDGDLTISHFVQYGKKERKAAWGAMCELYDKFIVMNLEV